MVPAAHRAVKPVPTKLDIRRVRNAADAVTGLLRALGNEDRLLLLCQLSHGERCVGELESLLGIRQPTLSQQLGVLRNAGLVATRRMGRQIRYRIADDRALVILGLLHELYCPGRR